MKKKKKFDISDCEACLYCTASRSIAGDELLLCQHKGLVPEDGKCRRFELDLLAVNPKKLRGIKADLCEDDFKL